MAEPAVVNSSPLIFLARAGLIDYLQLASPEVLVPAQVVEEIERRGSSDPAVQVLRSERWLRRVAVPRVPGAIEQWSLGSGESSVLAWCQEHPGTEAIVDDLAARRCAQVLGLPVRGTLGLVLIAKRRGRIPAARPVLEELRRSGMYLSDRVLESALARVGES